MNGATEAGSPSPLSGVRVLDMSRVLAGPLATMTLGDLGADVIKVERPEEGDDTRHWGPPFAGDDAAYFLSLNRNKRSVAIDLKTPEGTEAIRQLASESDVVIENFRPGLMESLGIGLDDLRASDPRLITCSLTAFSEATSESASRPGYDIIVQALSGLMSVTGEAGGEPTKAGVALLDVIAGLYATIGILAALHERDSTGRGRHVSVSLFDASVAAMVNQAANYLIGGEVPRAMGSQHPNIVPYQVFHASDRPFILAGGNDRIFARTSQVLGHPEWADNPDFSTNEARVLNRDRIVGLIAEVLRMRTAADWLAVLDNAGVPCSPIRSMDEVFDSPEGAATIQRTDDASRGELRLVGDPIRFDGMTLPIRRPPPTLGQHTSEILEGLEAPT